MTDAMQTAQEAKAVAMEALQEIRSHKDQCAERYQFIQSGINRNERKLIEIESDIKSTSLNLYEKIEQNHRLTMQKFWLILVSTIAGMFAVIITLVNLLR